MRVQAYDPEKSQGKNLSQKYQDLFFETRKAFIAEASKTPIAFKNYRLQVLQHNLDQAIRSKNVVLANQTMEQAAKEEGGFYTNKIQHSGDKANPILGLYEQIKGSSLPVVYDVEGEYTNVEQEVPKSQAVEQKQQKPGLYGRD